MKLKALAAAGAAVIGLAIPASAGATTLIGSGSVAAQPVLTALFDKYEKLHKDIKFVYTANGGNAGVQDVQNGTSQFAGQARSPLPSDAGTTYVKMYLDGLCMDVHPSNKLKDISIEDTARIYHAEVTSWGDIPGGNLTSTIDPVGRDTNGGTYNFFLQAVLNNIAPATNVNALTSDGLVVNAVKRDPDAIGYAGLAWQGKGMSTLTVNGVPCAAKQVKSQKYPLSRYIFIVLPTDNPNPDVTTFIDWARTSKAAGKIINKAGGVATFNKGFR
jgi:phosphate transport system substrate-binding protein